MSKKIEQVQLKKENGIEIMPINTAYDVFMDYGSDTTLASQLTSINSRVTENHNMATATAQDLTTYKTTVSNALAGKQSTINGAATTITGSNLTANRALISNASGKVGVSDTSSTELGYVKGVTSAIQTQLNNKVPTSRKVNGKALSADISLSAADVGAYSKTEIDNNITGINNNLNQKIEFNEEGEAVVAGYTNQIPFSIDTDGTIYNETGYKNGYRWSSSAAAETAESGMGITGYIPCKVNDVLRIKNVTFPTNSYIVCYNANKTPSTIIKDFGTANNEGVYTRTLSDANTAYIRLSIGTIDQSTIVTINEEITTSGTFTTGWLKDSNDNQIAPKTVISQVIGENGTLYDTIVLNRIDDVKKYVNEEVAKKATPADIINAINGLDSSVTAESGKYISAITQTNGKITATKTSLPSLSGGSSASNDATVVGGVTASGHTFSVGKKTLKGGANVSVTGGTNEITIASSHPSISKEKDTLSTSLPEHGQTFTAIDSITRDDFGHVTKINTKTVQLPEAGLHYIPVDNFTTVAGSDTTDAYLAAKWHVSNVDSITVPQDGMSISFRTPTAGNKGGILLSINGGTTYYPIIRNTSTLVTTNYPVGSTLILTFNSEQETSPYLTAGTATAVTGCWQIADYDSNTTYSNVKLGHGYAACSTAASTVAKTASISSSFAYTTGGTVSIRFTNGNTASKPTLNINSKGAKNIYFNNAALTDTSLIKAGDVVTFMYSSNFHIIAINGVSVTAGAYGPSSNITLSPTNKTFTVPQITTDQTGRITGAANRTMTLPNFALSDTIGGSAKMAEAVNITRPTKSILEVAGDMDLFTEKVFFFGSDGFTYGAPSNYVIINAKKGANHRTILDCYNLQNGDHHINGCMNAQTGSTQSGANVWTGWILQPNPTSLEEAKTMYVNVTGINEDTFRLTLDKTFVQIQEGIMKNRNIILRLPLSLLGADNGAISVPMKIHSEELIVFNTFLAPEAFGNTMLITILLTAEDVCTANTYYPFEDVLAQAGNYVDERLNDYYTASQINNLNLISVAEIDAICGATIQVANEGVKF